MGNNTELALAIWREHGGEQHGPRVETLTMPLANFDGFLAALRQPDTSTKGGEWVTVPRAALDWLFGEGPDADGRWFGDFPGELRPFAGSFWWRKPFRDWIAAAPQPAVKSSEGEGFAVKPLDWTRNTGDSLSRAETIVGTYRVWTFHGAGEAWFWRLNRDDGANPDFDVVTEIDAKAACQADYDARIRSTLIQSTSPEAAGMVVSELMVAAAAQAAHASASKHQRHPKPWPDLSAQQRLWYAEDARAALTAALSASEPHAPTDHDYAKALTIKSHGTWIDLATLLWWRQLVDANPADLAPRLDKRIEDCYAWPPEASEPHADERGKL